ncbi:uncharacterized protein DUF2262 [Lacibacter cauensis]|uniref:Uncharacterized protein DUF2262 n=1 Tax=Lacibacter cauensis TaxID=510947 RepID=A0A562SYN3_9BACT|nr:DUF2262 domain-containing protein [Lacibacter cauensis]TWI80111.1 uncharacterized protein DUF2262 [Lacibacter cauensis]TWI85816.1 uncharacterized protein DUF2262 [Lacibacter cauensis]
MVYQKNKKVVFTTSIVVDELNIQIEIDPEDVSIDEHLEMVNRVIDNYSLYEDMARKKIIEDFLSQYDNIWVDEDHTELNQADFAKNLSVKRISFLSNTGIDFIYDEKRMFGFHSLVAHSFDGEKFEYTSMLG